MGSYTDEEKEFEQRYLMLFELETMASEINDSAYPYCMQVCERSMSYFDGDPGSYFGVKVNAICDKHLPLQMQPENEWRSYDKGWIAKSHYPIAALRFFEEVYTPIRIVNEDYPWMQAFIHGMTKDESIMVMEPPLMADLHHRDIINRLSRFSNRYSHILNVCNRDHLHILFRGVSRWWMMVYEHTDESASKAFDHAVDLYGDLLKTKEAIESRE